MTNFASDLQRALTRAAINGARSVGLSDDRIRSACRASRARLDSSNIEFTDAQLLALARSSKRSLGELLVAGDPETKGISLRDPVLREGIEVLRGLREMQEMARVAGRRTRSGRRVPSRGRG